MTQKRKARRRGRPSFRPTAEQRRHVEIAAGGGVAPGDIATALKIPRTTLLKHFEHELTHGAHARRQEVIGALYRAAKKGNVSAARAFLAEEPKIGAPPPPPDAPKTDQTPLGKKAQANADAKDAPRGTEWSDLIGPRPSTVQ